MHFLPAVFTCWVCKKVQALCFQQVSWCVIFTFLITTRSSHHVFSLSTLYWVFSPLVLSPAHAHAHGYAREHTHSERTLAYSVCVYVWARV